jgi:hypothetical protein
VVHPGLISSHGLQGNIRAIIDLLEPAESGILTMGLKKQKKTPKKLGNL